MEVCKQRKLNPFVKQIHAVVRQGKMVIQTAIDGYRLIAERTGKYLGQTPPMWCGKDGVWKDVWLGPGDPFAAKIGVYKAGMMEPTWAVGYWSTYNAPGPFWQKSGASQLSKCVEALALRKAFPEELSGVYTDDELDQANTMVVESPNVPVTEAEIVQPVLLFPKVVKIPFQTPDGPGCLLEDTDGLEWIANGESHVHAIDQALEDGTPLVVHFVVDTGRRVITSVAEG